MERIRARAGRESARTWGPVIAWILLASLAAIGSGWAAKAADAGDADEKPAPVVQPAPTTKDAGAGATSPMPANAKASGAAILYVPPSRGSARHTAGAGTRGVGGGRPRAR